MSTVSVGLVRLHRHFKGLPEDYQGNLAGKEGFAFQRMGFGGFAKR